MLGYLVIGKGEFCATIEQLYPDKESAKAAIGLRKGFYILPIGRTCPEDHLPRLEALKRWAATGKRDN
jgi:hypothetical protein